MSFSGSTLIANYTDKTDASFESDPPYEFGWAQKGSLVFKCDNWGNTDNTLVCDLYWGVPTRGILPTNAGIIWVKDATLTTTIAGSGGATTDVAGYLAIPHMNSKYMKVVFTLAGTTKEVDLNAWFYGKS